MNFKLAIASATLLLAAATSSGDHIFVNLFETDSAELLEAGVRSFSNTANCKEFGDRFESWLENRMLVPSTSWLNRSRPIRFIRTIDPQKPIDENNPAILTIAEMKDLGGTIGKICADLYRRRTPIGTYGALYRDPVDTNLPPQVAIAAEAKHILISPSPEQLSWGWEYRQRFIGAPRQNIHGNFRMLINSGRFAELLPLLHPNFARQPFVAPLIKNFKNLAIALNFDGSAFSMAIRGQPEESKELYQIIKQWESPEEGSWQKLPSNLLFSSLIGGTPPNFTKTFIPAPLDKLIWPIGSIADTTECESDCPTILHQAPDGKSFIFGSVRKFKPGKATALPLDALDKIKGSNNDGIEWIKEPVRSIDGTSVHRYKLALTGDFAKAGAKHPDLDLIKSLIMIFFKNVHLELAVRDSSLYTALGTDKPMDQCLELINASGQYKTVDKIISVSDRNMNGIKPLFAALIRGSGIGLSMVRNFPGVTSENISDLSASNDGLTIAAGRDAKTGAFTLSLRVDNSEISALGMLNDKARPLVTELFFNLISEKKM